MSTELIVTQCSHCGNRFNAPVTSSGKQAICGKCGNMFIVLEKAPQMTIYAPPGKSEDDDILTPPVQTPTYKETPIKPDPATLRRLRQPSGSNQSLPHVPPVIEPAAPHYRTLQFLARTYAVLGVLGMIVGLVLLGSVLFGTQAPDGGGRGLLAAWGFGMVLAGILAFTVGQALRTLADIALNSFAWANR